MTDRYTISIKETRKALGLGRTTIYKLLALGQLQRVKIAGRTLVTVSSIESLVESSMKEGHTAIPAHQIGRLTTQASRGGL